MMEAHAGVSDLIFCVGRPFQVEAFGELKPVEMHAEISRLTPYQTEIIAMTLLQENPDAAERLVKTGTADLSYSLPSRARFRMYNRRQPRRFLP